MDGRQTILFIETATLLKNQPDTLYLQTVHPGSSNPHPVPDQGRFYLIKKQGQNFHSWIQIGHNGRH